jgi:hypothetical protein
MGDEWRLCRLLLEARVGRDELLNQTGFGTHWIERPWS